MKDRKWVKYGQRHEDIRQWFPESDLAGRSHLGFSLPHTLLHPTSLGLASVIVPERDFLLAIESEVDLSISSTAAYSTVHSMWRLRYSIPPINAITEIRHY